MTSPLPGRLCNARADDYDRQALFDALHKARVTQGEARDGHRALHEARMLSGQMKTGLP